MAGRGRPPAPLARVSDGDRDGWSWGTGQSGDTHAPPPAERFDRSARSRRRRPLDADPSSEARRRERRNGRSGERRRWEPGRRRRWIDRAAHVSRGEGVHSPQGAPTSPTRRARGLAGRGGVPVLNSWGFSGMGFGAAGALGAKLAAPDRPVVAIAGDGCFTMVPHVLCTAVEYNIPVVWVIWNNFGWVSIRDIQLGMFGGREHGTMFHQGENKKPYNPDFAAWAKATGVDAMTITKSQDFKGALEHAVKANKPFVLDVHVDAEVRPPSTGAWELPPTPYKEPVFGQRFLPDAAPVK